jgi:hypothetical protein
MLAGAVIHALGIMLTLGNASSTSESFSGRIRPPLVPAGFDIAVLGAALGILGIAISKLRESTK